MNDSNKSIRIIACELLSKVIYNKAYPDITLKNYFENNKTSHQDRRLITEIVYGVLRWKLKLEYIVSLKSIHRQKNRFINLLLYTSLYQILYLDSIPDYAIVNEAVKIAKNRFGHKISNYINALLRETIRTKDSYSNIVFNDPIKTLSIKYSFPAWLIEYWSENLSIDEIIHICKSLNYRPSSCTIRINCMHTSRDNVIGMFENTNIVKPTDLSPYGLIVEDISGPLIKSLYDSGIITIQDEASQLISTILDPKHNEKILDLCSAPGTKTTHIAEIINDNGEIYSCDINPSRLKLVQRDCKRIGIKSVKTFCVDSRIIENVFKDPFDRILVDAPCSGFGTIRNNPDIKWTKSLKNISELSRLQYQLLDAASRILKKGGTLLYSVCTISYKENEKIINNFLANHSNYKIDASHDFQNDKINRLFNRKGYFTTSEKLDVMDGFFAVKFTKFKD